VLKDREIRQFGEYRTQRLVLASFDELSKSDRFRGQERECTHNGQDVDGGANDVGLCGEGSYVAYGCLCTEGTSCHDYKNYIEGFVRIRDKRIDGFVHEQFASGALWPDPILQLNPAYEPRPDSG